MSDSVILAFDTCTPTLSAALKVGDRLWEKVIECGDQTPTQQQSALLLPTLQGLLDQAGVTYADLTHVVVTKGPGSFTGIRLGLAAAQGLQLATKAQFFSPTSLQVLAFQGGKTLALMDNQRGGYFGQVFSPDIEPLEPARIWTKEEGDNSSLRGAGGNEAIQESTAKSLIYLVETHPDKLDSDLQPFYLVTPTYAKLPHHT